MVGALVKRERERRGLSQEELAELSGLRQEHISSIETGKTRVPRDHNIDALGKVLGLTRADFYRAAGMLEGVKESEPDAPVQLSLGDPDEKYNPIDIVAYVEARPGVRFQQQLKVLRDRLPRAAYIRFCVGLFNAWASNSNLAMTSTDLHEVES